VDRIGKGLFKDLLALCAGWDGVSLWSGSTRYNTAMSIRRKIIKRWLRKPLTGLCLPGFLVPVVLSAQSPPPLNLQQSLESVAWHERVIAAKQSAQAAQADIRIADRDPVPLLTGSLSSIDLEHGLGSGPLWSGKTIDKGLGLDWIWERGNKRTLRTAAARSLASASQAEFQEIFHQQQLTIVDLFYETLLFQEQLKILGTLAQRAEQLEKLAAQRFALGDLSAQDLARLEIESARASAEAKQSRWLLDRAKHQLRLAIGPVLSDTRLGPMANNPITSPKADESISDSSLGDRASASHVDAYPWEVSSDWPVASKSPTVDFQALAAELPALKASLARLSSAQSQIELARALDFRDPSYGVGINHYPGTSKAMIALRASVPLYSRHYFEGEKQRALALVQVAQTLHAELLRRTITELELLYQRRENACNRLLKFENEMLPKSVKIALQAEKAFTQGGQTITDLLEARRNLKSIQLEALQARIDFSKADRTWTIRLDRPMH
jgi:cobalt-zinc-cadmium efflux system outer membrane protein